MKNIFVIDSDLYLNIFMSDEITFRLFIFKSDTDNFSFLNKFELFIFYEIYRAF